MNTVEWLDGELRRVEGYLKDKRTKLEDARQYALELEGQIALFEAESARLKRDKEILEGLYLEVDPTEND